jgi:hypothetical protein
MIDMNFLFALMVQILSLAGMSALIAVIINTLKYFGVIKDGKASGVSAILNFFALFALVALKIYRPDILLEDIDIQLSFLAQILGLLLTLITQFGISFKVHEFLKNAVIPIWGKSYSEDEWNRSINSERGL